MALTFRDIAHQLTNMSMFARTALRRSTPVVSRPQVRNMSGHGTPQEMHGAFLSLLQRLHEPRERWLLRGGARSPLIS